MRATRLVVGCSLLLVPSSLFADDAATARAAELWALARAAKGGSALDAVQSLSATGTFRRTLPGAFFPRRAPEGFKGPPPPLTGDLRIDWRLPSQYKRLEASTSPDGSGFGFVCAIDGDEAWMAPLGDRPRPEGTGEETPGRPRHRPGPPDGEPRPDFPGMQRREIANERTRSLLVLLLAGLSDDGWVLSVAGEAETPAGYADVIEVRGPNDFVARLFFDTATHLPVELRYEEDRPLPPFPGPRPLKATPGKVPPPPPPGGRQVALLLADYRDVDGIQLPSRMSRAVDGETVDEWEIGGWRVNPPESPQSFRHRSGP
jgi:hypothetical protein